MATTLPSPRPQGLGPRRSAIQRGAGASRSQRGAAALIVTMVLFFAMLLVAAYANRNLVFDQRSAANQVRSTQAFEAAEAGLEWALVQLNHPQGVDARCLPSSAATDASFRQRYVTRAQATAPFSGVTWTSGGGPLPLQASCVRAESGWSCSCPSAGHPTLAPVTQAAVAPAFALQFLAGDKPGVVRLVSQGCTSVAGPCAPGGTGAADATARVEVALALLPALSSAPLAPLTVRGAVDTMAALSVQQPDPSQGGLAVHAGAAVHAPQMRIIPSAGGLPSAAVAEVDTTLAGITAEALFNRHFGLGKAAWARLPGVTSLVCAGSCGGELQAAISAQEGEGMIVVTGDTRLDGPLTLGSAQQPVLLVIQGAVQFSGDVVIHGLVHAASVQWSQSGGGPGGVHGALVSESGYSGTGVPDLVYDSAVLKRLQQRGGFARVSGSWRDF